MRFGNLVRAPSPSSALPPLLNTPRLALKLFRGEPAISRFDWPFTPIHSSSDTFSTDNRFGPPRRVTATSPWPRIDHLASGLPHATQSPYSDSLSLRLRAIQLNLAAYSNSPAHSAKGTPSPCLHLRDIGLRLLVGIRFQVLFHSPLGVLFTFPSRYWFTIGHQRVFSLGGWSSRIPTGFLRAPWYLGS